ncbi:MAG: outer membrane beta-barrel protein [Candidatus Krumholzibacteriia bacterium]
MRSMIVMTLLLSLASLAWGQDTQLSGFADASYFYDANAQQGEFGLDQVEVDVTHQASAKTMVRADLEWVKDGDAFVARVEQAYMEYRRDCGTTLRFGRFNAPIGFELLDPPDMYQFSHSLVFDHGLPTNLTGLALSRQLSEQFDIVAYACNGWDLNTEDNKHLTFGGRLGYAAPYGATAGLSAISGEEGVGVDAFTRTVFDVDLGYTTGAWTFGGEFNRGQVTLDDASKLEWTGFLLMGHYDVNDWLGFTGRYDSFDDQDGYAFGLAQTRSSLTFAPTFVLDDGFGALVEIRLDMSDEDVFTDSDGAPSGDALTMAFEMTYTW